MTEEKKPLWKEFCECMVKDFYSATCSNTVGFNSCYSFIDCPKFQQIVDEFKYSIRGKSDTEIFKAYFEFREKHMVPGFNDVGYIECIKELNGKSITTTDFHRILKESFEEDQKPKLDPKLLKPIEDKINTSQQWIAATQDKIAFIAEAIDKQTKLLETIMEKLKLDKQLD